MTKSELSALSIFSAEQLGLQHAGQCSRPCTVYLGRRYTQPAISEREFETKARVMASCWRRETESLFPASSLVAVLIVLDHSGCDFSEYAPMKMERVGEVMRIDVIQHRKVLTSWLLCSQACERR
jgi:hypothetical protein